MDTTTEVLTALGLTVASLEERASELKRECRELKAVLQAKRERRLEVDLMIDGLKELLEELRVIAGER